MVSKRQASSNISVQTFTSLINHLVEDFTTKPLTAPDVLTSQVSETSGIEPPTTTVLLVHCCTNKATWNPTTLGNFCSPLPLLCLRFVIPVVLVKFSQPTYYVSQRKDGTFLHLVGRSELSISARKSVDHFNQLLKSLGISLITSVFINLALF